jgi:hypothetical protein
MIKQMVRASIVASTYTGSGQGDGVGATNKYCAKDIEDDEDEDEANEDEDKEEEDRVEAAAQGKDDDLAALEALLKPLSSSPTPQFITSRRDRSPRRYCCSRPSRHQDL